MDRSGGPFLSDDSTADAHDAAESDSSHLAREIVVSSAFNNVDDFFHKVPLDFKPLQLTKV